MTLIPRRRPARRLHTDIPAQSPRIIPSAHPQSNSHAPLPSSKSNLVSTNQAVEGTVYFNDRTEVEWVLRGGLVTKVAAKKAVEKAGMSPKDIIQTDLKPALVNRRSRKPSELGMPRLTHETPSGDTTLGARRRKLRRRGRRGESWEYGISGRRHEISGAHEFYDVEFDQNWRIPLGKGDPQEPKEGKGNRWSMGTASEGDMRSLRGNAFQADRSDRRRFQGTYREEACSGRPRDRPGGRIGGGARWRGLIARKDLVDSSTNGFASDSGGACEDLSPRSSLDIEEANSLWSWDEPPSTSVRGWKSNHSLSYKPKPNDRPRLISDIGRQKCINDLTDIVDASNEPCVSYDRQIFDRVSKLWTYVDKREPLSSPWELRTVSSPVTWSVSGTEEGVSMRGTTSMSVGAATSAPSLGIHSIPTSAPPSVPSVAVVTDRRLETAVTEIGIEEDLETHELNRRKTLSPKRRSNASLHGTSHGTSRIIPSAEEATRAFMATRNKWLGYSRKSVYGPANLEAVIFASEMDDAQEDMCKRQRGMQ